MCNVRQETKSKTQELIDEIRALNHSIAELIVTLRERK